MNTAEAAWLAGLDSPPPRAEETASQRRKRLRAEQKPRTAECYVCGAIWPLAPVFGGERRTCLYCVDKLDR